jgi:hypothetical protein
MPNKTSPYLLMQFFLILPLQLRFFYEEKNTWPAAYLLILQFT